MVPLFIERNSSGQTTLCFLYQQVRATENLTERVQSAIRLSIKYICTTDASGKKCDVIAFGIRRQCLPYFHLNSRLTAYELLITAIVVKYQNVCTLMCIKTGPYVYAQCGYRYKYLYVGIRVLQYMVFRFFVSELVKFSCVRRGISAVPLTRKNESVSACCCVLQWSWYRTAVCNYYFAVWLGKGTVSVPLSGGFTSNDLAGRCRKYIDYASKPRDFKVRSFYTVSRGVIVNRTCGTQAKHYHFTIFADNIQSYFLWSIVNFLDLICTWYVILLKVTSAIMAAAPILSRDSLLDHSVAPVYPTQTPNLTIDWCVQ